MRILAIELHRTHSIGCHYETTSKDKSARWRCLAAPTSPKSLLQLLSLSRPDRMVMELSVRSIWVANLAESMSVKVQFADMAAAKKLQHRHEIDPHSVVKLARLSALQELPVIELSDRDLDELKALFLVRHELSQRIKAVDVAAEMLENLPDDVLPKIDTLNRNARTSTQFMNRTWIQNRV